MPSGAYGDSMGGMTLAGGIVAALYERRATGHPPVVDVSLLGVGAWATQFSVNLALASGGPLPSGGQMRRGSATNPLIGAYRTSDGRWIMLSMLQPGRYWAEFCRAAGRDDLVTDERFDSTEKIMANAAIGAEIVDELFESKTFDEWCDILGGVAGQWAAVQSPWEVGQDQSLRANGLIAPITDAEGRPRELVASPVQFDESVPGLARGPQFAEHTDQILSELGFDDDARIALKIAGAVT